VVRPDARIGHVANPWTLSMPNLRPRIFGAVERKWKHRRIEQYFAPASQAVSVVSFRASAADPRHSDSVAGACQGSGAGDGPIHYARQQGICVVPFEPGASDCLGLG